ncbi:MAG: hypothetical protein ACR2JM_12095 [Mycobacterium sp.]
MELADLGVVVTRCDVRAVAATSSTVEVLRTLNPNLGLVVRGPAPGGLSATAVAETTALPLLAAMRPEPMLAVQLESGGLRLGRRSPLAHAARAVLDALARHGKDRAA